MAAILITLGTLSIFILLFVGFVFINFKISNTNYSNKQKLFVNRIGDNFNIKEQLNIEIYSSYRHHNLDSKHSAFKCATIAISNNAIFVIDGHRYNWFGKNIGYPMILTKNPKRFWKSFNEIAIIGVPHKVNTKSFDKAIHIEYHPKSDKNAWVQFRIMDASESLISEINQLFPYS